MPRFGLRDALGVSVLAVTTLSAVACPFSSLDRSEGGDGGMSNGASDGGSGAGTGPCAGATCANGNGGCGLLCPVSVKGEACNTGSPCASGLFCVDEVCCDGACKGLCEACTKELTGVEDGTCSPVMLGSVATGECSDKGGCGVGNQCRCEDGEKNGDEAAVDCGGGSCPKCGTGAACVVDSQCEADTCNNNTCCPANSPCNECQQCGPGGECLPLALASEGECSNGKTCSADLKCKLKNGEQCISNSDCASKACVWVGNVMQCGMCATDMQCNAWPAGDATICSGGWCKGPVASACTTDLDCATNRCVGGVCQECSAMSPCASGACQGGVCPLAAGNPCSKNGDCAGNSCQQGVCQAP